jgi:ABC-type sugar transport system ATPase subunit
VLRVERLSGRGAFQDVTFAVRAGEIFALTGLVGSGRSSVARAIFGAAPVASGRIVVGDDPGPFLSPRAAMRAGIAMLPEDRKGEGLLLQRPLRENITLAHREDAATLGLLNIRRERRLTRDLMARHDVRAAGTEVAAATLSGGNQQKAMLARWLQRPYRVIILDEPTRGVDVGAKAEMYQELSRLAADGAAILMISSELPEVIGMADRIGVMHEGRLMGILDNADRRVTQDAIMRLAVGEAS